MVRPMRKAPLFCSLFILLSVPLMPAFGQADIRESVAGFTPDFFAGSNPTSAMEMVQLLPGFRFQEGDPLVRGYSGALGNVLIDGRPPASKQDTLEVILRRIPAASVQRIELIRPGAAGIDMQGYALMANVVRNVSNAPHGRVEAETIYAPHYGAYAPRLAGEVSLGSEQVLELSATLERILDFQRGGIGTRNRFAPDGTTLTLATAKSFRYEDDWTVTGNYRQPLLGGSVRFNALYKDTRAFADELEARFYPATVNAPGITRDFTAASEFNLQYQHRLWTGGQAELVGIRRSSLEHAAQTVTSSARDDSSFAQTYTSETILRGALRQRLGAFSLESGVESAINTLNNDLAYVSDGVDIPLPGANVRISEWRTEFFSTATWQARPNLTLETGLRYEMSSLKQQSASTLKKDLYFLKPRMLVSWKPFAKDELRFIYERRAGQLDFTNFIPMLHLATNMITVGNANLEPYTLWHAEVSWEHRIAAGSVVLTARHENIDNAVDHVAVYSPAGAFDGIGNIGSGQRDEFQADFLLPLDGIDLAGVTLQGSLLRRISQVTDPTTLEKRRITMENGVEGTVNLTDDIPKLNLRWGATFTHAQHRANFRFDEIRYDDYPETFDLFVEYKPRPQWLIRMSAMNILDRPVYHTREIYYGPRNSTALNYREPRLALSGVRVGLNVQRTFGD